MKILRFVCPNEKKEKKIKIAEPQFVNRYKHIYKIIYENKIYPFQSEFEIKGEEKNKIKIKIICYNNISYFQFIKRESNLYNLIYHENNKYKNNINRYPRYSQYPNNYFIEIFKITYKIDIEETKKYNKKTSVCSSFFSIFGLEKEKEEEGRIKILEMNLLIKMQIHALLYIKIKHSLYKHIFYVRILIKKI